MGRCESSGGAAASAMLLGVLALAASAPGQGIPRVFPGAPPSAAEGDRRVRATLPSAPIEGVLGGETETAVLLSIDPGWHVYWENPGDSGVPVDLGWDLPQGVEAGAPRWPRPQIFAKTHETTFGYEREVGLVVPLRIGSDALPGEHPIRLRVQWMVCKEVCLMGAAEVRGTIVIHPAEAALPGPSEVLARWIARVPAEAPPEWIVRIDPRGGTEAGARQGFLRIAGGSRGFERIRFLPLDTPGVAYRGRIPASAAVENDRFELLVPLSIRPGDALGGPLRAAGVVIFGDRLEDPSVAVAVHLAPG